MTVFEVAGRIGPPPGPDYLDHTFQVPASTGGLRVELDFDKVVDRFQLYAALFDPDHRFRGHVQCPGGTGRRNLSFWVGPDSSSPGAIPGEVPPGQWTVRVDLDRHREAGNYHLRVLEWLEGDPVLPSAAPHSQAMSPTPLWPAAAGWLRGELHAHSVHSDGRDTVAALVQEAARIGLDFLAVTDHFTWSHWRELPTGGDLVTLNSIEVTTHRGHANVHGLSHWVDVYVDRPGRRFAELADDIHQVNGLVCVNHPFSGQQAWRRTDSDWHSVDLLEVFNQSQDANNDAAIGLWDRLLAQGYDIAPVAGTDCHDSTDPSQRLGQVVTMVPAQTRDRGALLDALGRGATVVSRGAALDLRLRARTGQAGLGERLQVCEQVHVEVDIVAETPTTLYIMRDGLMWLQRDVEPGTSKVVILDDDPVVGCYRAEVHQRSDDPRHTASAMRSHASLAALTSFIRVTA
ncbi:MAG: CehA/McbA family metallohydrolase [Arachnia sp.]